MISEPDRKTASCECVTMSDAIEEVQLRVQEAKSSIKKALETVERSKASENTAQNPEVAKADGLVNEALLKIQTVVEKLDDAKKDSKLVEEYRDLVEEGRQQFRHEIAALLPDASPEGMLVRKGPLSQDELDVFVTHAYRKVCRLQQELAKQKTLAQQRLETGITDEQLRKQVVTEEVVQAELEAQRRLLEVEHQRKMAGIREEMENEVSNSITQQNWALVFLSSEDIDITIGEQYCTFAFRCALNYADKLRHMQTMSKMFSMYKVQNCSGNMASYWKNNFQKKDRLI